jgi:membrane fusion protein (multidrug efflux system)
MKYLFTIATLVMLAACQTEDKNSLTAKKQELEKTKTELADLKKKISDLEKEIRAEDPSFGKAAAIKVEVMPVTEAAFERFTEVRGSAESRRNVAISSQMGGEVRRVHVREGQQVAKGQVLVSLNADVLESTLAELKTSYELAKTTYERQERLWNQKIGTEIQYLQAKNQKEATEKRIAATEAQLDQLILRAPFTGTVDQVDAREGQMASPGVPLVRLLSASDLYITADVSDDFIGKIKAGDKVKVFFPGPDTEVSSYVASVGQVINPENRTFQVEIKLPDGAKVQPNQIAAVTFRDYVNPKTIAVPTRLIQRDSQGQFVFVVQKGEQETVARKAYIQTGVSYNGNTEVVSGLSNGQWVVGAGFREVADGMEIEVTETAASPVAKG